MTLAKSNIGNFNMTTISRMITTLIDTFGLVYINSEPIIASVPGLLRTTRYAASVNCAEVSSNVSRPCTAAQLLNSRNKMGVTRKAWNRD